MVADYLSPFFQDIRALFPPDCNPFYAGFGNRDTDEISYLKVGIPKGKIFIINPKGEVAVNRWVDTKSYSSLHSLVNGIFPARSSAEQSAVSVLENDISQPSFGAEFRRILAWEAVESDSSFANYDTHVMAAEDQSTWNCMHSLYYKSKATVVSYAGHLELITSLAIHSSSCLQFKGPSYYGTQGNYYV
ncbi:hypothetical protein ACLOJK_013695 [Asimina triloba]